MVQRGMEATSPSKFFGPLAGGACFGSIFIPLCFFFWFLALRLDASLQTSLGHFTLERR
jgi:hypothetical protein